jgi:hypothetical protein
MTSRKAFTLFFLSSAGLAALLPLRTALAKPDAEASSWTIARTRLVCGTDAGGGVSACRFTSDVARTAGAADHGVITIVAIGPGGREMGCWNGERLAGSAPASTVHVLAPADVLARATSFDVFVSSWGCWGTPAALGPRTHVPRATAARDASIVNEARERARRQLEQSESHDDPDPAGVLDLGPVLPRPGAGEGC